MPGWFYRCITVCRMPTKPTLIHTTRRLCIHRPKILPAILHDCISTLTKSLTDIHECWATGDIRCNWICLIKYWERSVSTLFVEIGSSWEEFHWQGIRYLVMRHKANPSARTLLGAERCTECFQPNFNSILWRDYRTTVIIESIAGTKTQSTLKITTFNLKEESSVFVWSGWSLRNFSQQNLLMKRLDAGGNAIIE